MRNKQEKKPPLWIVLLIILSVFGGIFTAIVGINNIKNYYNPYLFGLIFGGLGLIIGIWIAMKLKPIIAVNKRIRNDYFLPIMFFSIGLFGLFLMIGSFLNKGLSNIDNCDKFQIVNKYRQEYRYLRPEINSIVVSINGDSKRLVCSYRYWIRASISQNIDLCIHESKLGFDFITVTNDKK
jgi:hypothetical protein